MAALSSAATWHGAPAEWNDLWLAIEAHCDCAYDLLAGQPSICAAHLMLIQQVTLDHLVHGRRLRTWFVHNELCTEWPCFQSAA
jgi:hypothetical protein